MRSSFVVAVALVLPGLLCAARAGADEVSTEPSVRAEAAASDGTFSPSAASGLPVAGTVRTFAGADGAQRQPIASFDAGIRITSRFTLGIGVAYSTDKKNFGPGVSLAYRAVRQSDGGVDLVVSAGYKTEGFSEPEGEIEGSVLVAHTFGGFRLLGVGRYGQDFDAKERDAELGGTLLVPVGGRFVVGLDGLGRVNLSDTPAGTPAVAPGSSIRGGALAALSVDRFVVTAEAGGARSGTTLGAFGLLGVGAMF